MSAADPRLLHIAEYDPDANRWRPACRVWPELVPRSYPRRQRPTTNGGHCRACEAVVRRLDR